MEKITNSNDCSDIACQFLEWTVQYLHNVGVVRRFSPQISKPGSVQVWAEQNQKSFGFKFYNAKQLFQLFKEETEKENTMTIIYPVPTWESLVQRIATEATENSYYQFVDEVIRELENLRTVQPEKTGSPYYHDTLNHHLKREQQIDSLLKQFVESMGKMYYVPPENQSKVWDMAWERGHSSGYYGVFQELIELTDLFNIEN